MKHQVIIIDSGISELSLKGKVIGAVNLINNNDKVQDDNGHGTLCANIIASSCIEEVEFFVIKILNENKECSLQNLVKALEYAINIDIQVINLSLSTTNLNSMCMLKSIINKLTSQEKIVVASVDNKSRMGFPAEYNGVIGVDGIVFNEKHEYWYDKEKSIQCIGNRVPIMVKSINEKYEMFGGTSKATALMTANILGLLKEFPKTPISDLESILERRAIRTVWNDNEIENHMKFKYEVGLVHIEKNYLYKEIDNIIKEFFRESNRMIEKEDFRKYKLFNFLFPLDYYEILKKIEKNTGISLQTYEDIDYRVFESVSSLTKFFTKNI